MIKETYIESREHGLALRAPNIGASEIGALWNRHRWVSKLQLWLEKRNELPALAKEDTKGLLRGRIFEPAVARALEEKYGWKIEKCDHYYCDTELRLGASPDYELPDGTPVECKIVMPDAFESEWGHGASPPFYYQMQCHVQRRLKKTKKGILAALIPNAYGIDLKKHLHVFEIAADQAVDDETTRALADFWDSVVANRRPAEYSAVDNPMMAILHPRAPDKVVSAPHDRDLQTAFAIRAKMKAIIDASQAELDAAEARIKDAMVREGANALSTTGWTASYKIQNRKETVQKATSFPVLRVTRSL